MSCTLTSSLAATLDPGWAVQYLRDDLKRMVLGLHLMTVNTPRFLLNFLQHRIHS